MKTAVVFLAVLTAGALPATAQSTEFGVIFGGSARSVERSDGDLNLPGDFSFSRSAVDFYYATELEPGTLFKIKVGRIETPVGLETPFDGDPALVVRTDVQGHVEHIDALAEYRFSEPFGSAGIFGGLGLYRQVGQREAAIPDTSETTNMDYGFILGVNADFPLTRRYGVILDATHHWTRLPFRPRFLTVGAGLRVRF